MQNKHTDTWSLYVSIKLLEVATDRGAPMSSCLIFFQSLDFKELLGSLFSLGDFRFILEAQQFMDDTQHQLRT